MIVHCRMFFIDSLAAFVHRFARRIFVAIVGTRWWRWVLQKGLFPVLPAVISLVSQLMVAVFVAGYQPRFYFVAYFWGRLRSLRVPLPKKPL